jgi:hypothetical protein
MLPEIAAQIVALNNDGRSVRYIAQNLNIPRSTVQDALSRFRETHGFTRKPDLIIAGQQMLAPHGENCHSIFGTSWYTTSSVASQ